MPRPDRPLAPGADPVQRLAWDLRRLREQAGGPTYQALARKTQAGPDPRSATTLSDAAGGQACPSWPTLVAFVTACGGKPGEWRDRWQQAQAWRPGLNEPSQIVAVERPEPRPAQQVDDQALRDHSHTEDAPDGAGAAAAAAPETTPQLVRVSEPAPPPAHSSPVEIGAARILVARSVGCLCRRRGRHHSRRHWCGECPDAPAHAVSGTVTCVNGEAVVGVWIKAEEGDSGYASYLPSTDPERADFHYRLSENTRWTVNVGCGGSTENWLHPVHGVTLTSATQQNWLCDPDRDHYGCRPQYSSSGVGCRTTRTD